MQRFTRAERQVRLERARAVALRLVKRDFNISRAGEIVPYWRFDKVDITIVYLRPLSGSALPQELTIRYKGKIVYFLEWDDDRQYRSTYKPGEWGQIMLRCLQYERQQAQPKPPA